MAKQNSSSASSTTVTEPRERDVEAQKSHNQKKASHWELVFDQTHVTPEVLNWPYKGSGTEEDPYVVVYIDNDRRNPMLFPKWKKWVITLLVALVSLPLFTLQDLHRFNMLGQLSQRLSSSKLHRQQTGLFTDSGTGNAGSSIRILSLLRWYRPNSLHLRHRRRSCNSWNLPLRPGFRHRPLTMGSHVRTLRTTTSLLRNLRNAYCFQRRRSRLPEYPDAAHPTILRGSVWIIPLDQRRWCHCGHVPCI
jgi:hypothetical protein